MANIHKEKTTNTEFAKGGNTPMFGPQKVGEQKPGETSHDVTDGGSKFASGGSGKMFGYTGSQPAQSGITSAR